MSVKKQMCELCGAEISLSNFSKHLRRHLNNPETFITPKYALTHDGLECQFCARSFQSRKSLCNHERQCKKNPERQNLDYKNLKVYNERRASGEITREAWNKGLTKYNDERLAKRGENLSQRYKTGELIPSMKGCKHSVAAIEKIRATAIQKQLGGHPYRKVISYNGVSLDSSLELILVKRLDALEIKWQRCSRFPYVDNNGNHHTYTPDFYLPQYDIYLDPKNDFLINSINPALGYKDTDKIVWVMEQNAIKIIILNKYQVEHLTRDDISQWLNG